MSIRVNKDGSISVGREEDFPVEASEQPEEKPVRATKTAVKKPKK